MINNRLLRTLVALITTITMAACGGYGNSGGEFGATAGGVQDMGLARELIAAGRVPPPVAFLVEGMFSEHDLGLVGPLCANTLCLRSALGIAPTLAGESSVWVQIGMSSKINPDTFVRPSLAMIAVVDVSGSMGWTPSTAATDYPSPGQVSRELLFALAESMTPDDRVAIVTYGGQADVALNFVPGGDSRVNTAISGLATGGVTNMEAGLRLAYEVAQSATGTDEVRLMLFTDVQPNVGNTTPDSFRALAAQGASSGFSLTVFGLGVGLGQEVMNAMSDLRGGNAFSLFKLDDVAATMTDDWPWMVSPLAYNFALDLTLSQDHTLAGAYGFPGGAAADLSLNVSTVFLSRRKGALLTRITSDLGPFDTLRVDGALSYSEPDGTPVNDAVVTAYGGQALDSRGQYFQQTSVAKSTALAILVTAMHDAAVAYGGDPGQAIAIMAAATERFTGDAAAISDPALDPEVALANALLQLMRDGAPQGDLYGG